MTCPICLEDNKYVLHLECAHYICKDCVTILQRNNLSGCPLCRQGGNIDYTTFFPNTDSYSPQNIENWNNPGYLGRKGIQDDMTVVERDWIIENWGNIINRSNKEILERNKKYIILNYNNYMFGYYNSISRDDNNKFIFNNCQNLMRNGKFFKTSPPTREIDLNKDNIQIFSLV